MVAFGLIFKATTALLKSLYATRWIAIKSLKLLAKGVPARPAAWASGYIRKQGLKWLKNRGLTPNWKLSTIQMIARGNVVDTIVGMWKRSAGLSRGKIISKMFKKATGRDLDKLFERWAKRKKTVDTTNRSSWIKEITWTQTTVSHNELWGWLTIYIKEPEGLSFQYYNRKPLEDNSGIYHFPWVPVNDWYELSDNEGLSRTLKPNAGVGTLLWRKGYLSKVPARRDQRERVRKLAKGFDRIEKGKYTNMPFFKAMLRRDLRTEIMEAIQKPRGTQLTWKGAGVHRFIAFRAKKRVDAFNEI